MTSVLGFRFRFDRAVYSARIAASVVLALALWFPALAAAAESDPVDHSKIAGALGT